LGLVTGRAAKPSSSSSLPAAGARSRLGSSSLGKSNLLAAPFLPALPFLPPAGLAAAAGAAAVCVEPSSSDASSSARGQC
jgi:hypothetical protein